ncbi:MAG: transporter [Acidobacteria bacterium SCN 69-37]|nr:MAG: transporter [Acidobacteria bacterium SCN 69-37]
MMRRGYPLAVAVALLTTSACATVGPDYTRPDVTPPAMFRGAEAAPDATAPALAETHWATVFVDEPLQELIGTALRENYDVRIAAARIAQAEATFGVTRSNQFPTVDAQAVGQGQRSSLQSSTGDARTAGVIQLGGTASWDLDFWGRYRRATESARAQLIATEWGRHAVAASLVSRVASAYYTLRALDLEREIAQRTIETRQESLRLTQVRERGGATSLVDVRQAEQLVLGARARLVDLDRLTAQQENLLSVLVGRDPGPVARGRALTDQPHAPVVPAGLPSDLIERRPDVRIAEQQIIAANAGIGVAKAAYFPRIALTGSGGVASTALSALFTGAAGAWTAAASAVQPVFNAGRTRSQVALAEARREEAELAYRQTVQQAFREVSDALVGYQQTQELRAVQESLVDAARDARRLADLRYQGGASSYLDVLDSDTRLFDAELGLVRARLGELTTFVEIYRALGGGWQD